MNRPLVGVLKPHLYWLYDHWWCRGIVDGEHYVGYGKTPADAYREWKGLL